MFSRINRAFKKSRAEDGFTLIELLIVIVIIGILAAIAIPVFLNAQNAAHDATVKSDARNTVIGVATALVTNPSATGFSVLAAGDTVAAVKLTGVPSVVVTVPTGAVAVRGVVTKSNWVTVRGTGADYVVHAQSTVDGFWYEFSSKTGKYTSSSDTPAVTPGVPSTTAPPGNSVQNPDGIAVRVDGAPVTTTGGAGGTGSSASGVPDACRNTPIAAKVVSLSYAAQWTFVSPTCSTAYVLSSNDKNVSVVNAGTGTVSKTISLSGNPTSMIFNAAGTKAYVIEPISGLDVIDTATDTFVTRIATYSDIESAIFSADKSKLYFSSYNSRLIGIVDLTANAYAGTVATGLYWGPTSLLLSPDGSKIFLANNDSSQPDHQKLDIIDIATGAQTRINLAYGSYQLFGLSMNSSGTELWVPSQIGITIFNVSDGSQLAFIPSMYVSNTISFSADGTKAYAVNGYSQNKITIISTATHTVIDSIQLSVAYAPSYLSTNNTVSPDGKWIAVTGDYPAVLYLVNVETKAITTFPLGGLGANAGIGESTMAFSPNSKWLFWSDDNNKSLHISAVG